LSFATIRFLRRNAPDVKGSAAREVSTEMREPQKRKGLGLSLATPLSIPSGEPVRGPLFERHPKGADPFLDATHGFSGVGDSGIEHA
jgi:hypothetical protein